MDKPHDPMRCSLRRVFLLILALLFLLFLGFFIFFIYLIMSGAEVYHGEDSFDYCIRTQWDGKEIDHAPVCLQMKNNASFLEIKVSGPFFDDPRLPDQPAGPFPKLYDYEVAEAFFLNNETKEYLEVELSPKSYHLVLMLRGSRNVLQEGLPLKFQSEITGNRWSGVAYVPAEYFPPKVNRLNAYAIHGSDESRTYEAMYPVPEGKYPGPDFHRLDYFHPIDFQKLMPDNYKDNYYSPFWS